MSITTLLFYICIIGFLGFIAFCILNNPITRLHQAVRNNDIEAVRNYLDKGGNVDIRRGPGVTPLCMATYNGYIKISELLLDRGADIDQGLEEENGVNPLLNAAINGHEELVEILLNRGAKIRLHFASWQGNLEIVRDYLNRDAPINSMRNRGMTPLHLAALRGQREIAELLLDYGADINFHTAASQTPLHQAVEGNNLEMVEFLADRGADLNYIGKTGSPLILAIRKDYESIIKLLIAKGTDVNSGSSTGRFPLHALAEKEHGKAEIAELLIANGADVNIQPDRGAGTPLHWAASSGNLAIARVLIHHGADVNRKTIPYGVTPLSKARGNREMTELLLANGATDYGDSD